MSLYTPFMSQAGANIGNAMAQRGQNKMASDAYMGVPGGMERLMQFNPKLGMEIIQQKQVAEQLKLQKAADEKKQFQELAKTKREFFDQALEDAANLDTYEEASAYLDKRKEEIRPEVGDIVDKFQFTPEMFSNIKKMYGGGESAFEGKGMPAQVSSALVKGANDPEFRNTAEYARAWDIANEPKIVDTEEGKVPLYPEISPIFKPPGKPKSEDKEISDIKSASEKDIKVIKGTEKTKTTADEKVSAGYFNRMQSAEANISEIGEFNSAGYWERIKGLTNITASPEMQKYRQAADDWIRAKLRRESGAVIGDDEMRKEYEIYFPQIGDSQAVIDQKEKARKEAINSMKIAAGRLAQSNDSGLSEDEADAFINSVLNK